MHLIENTARKSCQGKAKAPEIAPKANYSPSIDPSQLAFDGADIWVANEFSSTVTKLRARDGR